MQMTDGAWIEIIPDEDAEGMLKELYDQERDRRSGKIDNIMAIHSLNPDTLRAHADLYHTVMHGKSGLSYAEREMIGVVVSAINKCHY
jgi:alkylhydroperoxidase family enzyme